ncbi:MAG: small multi-drug export protein [Treponema sp.]|jgi:uncharacterized membrane protein|nr:small multi-drug export protein [Treponema sp.]
MSRPFLFFWTAFLSFMPISELRGAIPFALANGIPWYAAYPFAAAMNALVAPICWLFLSTVHKLFYGFVWYRRFFDHFVERARQKLHRSVERWGWIAVAAFVAVPLPVTGAWTGTLGAWVLGLSKRRTLPAVILGVACAGAVVTAAALLGIRAFSLFVKEAGVP